MKKIIYLLCAILPLGLIAQSESEDEKITRVQITIEKDGETKTITRELKDGDYESDIRVFNVNGDDYELEELAKAKYFMRQGNSFFTDEMHGEEKEVAFLGVIGHTQAIGDQKVVMLDEIVSEEPAAKAGLKPGDIIKSMDDAEVSSWEALVEMIHAHAPGDVVSMEVERSGKSKSYSITLGKKTYKVGGKMRLKYEVDEQGSGASNMRFFFTDELSDMERSIIRKKTGVVMNDKNTITDADIEMFPNPSPGKFDFELKLNEGGSLDISVFDASGSQIKKLSQKSDDGKYKGSFDISDSPPGPYMIVFEKDGKALVEKLLKF